MSNQGSEMSQEQQSIVMLTTIMDLARRARRAETAQALQFLLVNQTMPLLKYTIALLWVENEGVVLQSGVSQIDRNSPFIQASNEILEGLSQQTSLCIIESDMLTGSQLREWGEWLPSSAIWVPINALERKAGLLLCREDSFDENALPVLNEWVEIWTHAWVKLSAPTVQGELSKYWHNFKQRIPDQATCIQEMRYVIAGAKFVLAPVIAKANEELLDFKKRHKLDDFGLESILKKLLPASKDKAKPKAKPRGRPPKAKKKLTFSEKVRAQYQHVCDNPIVIWQGCKVVGKLIGKLIALPFVAFGRFVEKSFAQVVEDPSCVPRYFKDCYGTIRRRLIAIDKFIQASFTAIRVNLVKLWKFLSVRSIPLQERVKKDMAWAKEQGAEGVLQATLREAKAIWADKRRRWKWIIWTFILFPVRLSVLVPGELVPANPAIIRVPIEGVVDQFFVSPNDRVTQGQPLFKLDLASLLSKAQVAEQEIKIAQQEYRQGALQSLTDAKSRGQLAAQEGKAAERKIEADYLKDLLNRATIESPRDGIVIFDDPSEWVGKPVVAGEKVMVVATEGQVEVEAWIPVGDMLEVPDRASASLYLNASPFNAVSANIRYVGHEPMLRPDGTYAYRVRASLPKGKKGPRVGLKGTAKVNGQFVPLSYWVLRKPLAITRQFLGI
ncbi:HlyD family efflux transporter periplasmic adaptor subunit [Polynucleobacter sp. 30F-ANTBAC]|uniref:efflux RND transporter periplasmic adaptor subunit n=1 Tax=Polynucleobacter sp. 30F-ANTBAC TaxID=2689095 RepID=UPI001C0B351C|nr:HlyD family secretion protein [Polynucleobacter sp. 30F-ANTBAC]MBU3598897.1 HlyD family efflux transporter periplasmic adaptor subunit [Polynucleobacter sp. 30F-ANTBAC]